MIRDAMPSSQRRAVSARASYVAAIVAARTNVVCMTSSASDGPAARRDEAHRSVTEGRPEDPRETDVGRAVRVLALRVLERLRLDDETRRETEVEIAEARLHATRERDPCADRLHLEGRRRSRRLAL